MPVYSIVRASWLVTIVSDSLGTAETIVFCAKKTYPPGYIDRAGAGLSFYLGITFVAIKVYSMSIWSKMYAQAVPRSVPPGGSCVLPKVQV